MRDKLYEYAIERNDYNRISKLLAITDTDPAAFWENVRKLTKTVTSGHSLRRWQILSEAWYSILTKSE